MFKIWIIFQVIFFYLIEGVWMPSITFIKYIVEKVFCLNKYKSVK